MHAQPAAAPLDLSAFSVREGRLAPVICAACGCRLQQRSERWWHFAPSNGRDARGCTVECVEQPHYASGVLATDL